MSEGSRQEYEPYGHEAVQSKLERAFERCPTGHSIRRSRSGSYDPLAGVFYSPMQYEYQKVQPQSAEAIERATLDLPSLFLSFVKGEFGSGAAGSRQEHPEVVDRQVVGFEVVERYLRACEQLSYSSIIDSITLEHDASDVAGRLLAILSHPLVGNRKNKANIDHSVFAAGLAEQVDQDERLLFVLPAFPFKDQNPVRTNFAPTAHFDFSELALLIRLHALNIAFYQVHPFGADWLILSDGTLYADVFGVDRSEAALYSRRLSEVRNRLNLQGTVHIVSLEELLNHYDDGAGPSQTYEHVRYVVEARLRELVLGGREPALVEAFQVLARGMRKNLASSELGERFSKETLWRVVMESEPGGLEADALRAREQLDARAKDAAFTYASINLAMGILGVVERTLPQAIRATVHPKPGQVGVPELGPSFPWNGVAFCKDGNREVNATSVEAVPFYRLGTRYPRLRAHVLAEAPERVLFYSPA